MAVPPIFQEREIIDPTTDWIDMSNNQITKEGERYTDIISVDYFSDGKTLNATLWLLFPFKEIPKQKEIDYGMFIDADFNSKTGFGGIDYKVEIQWNNESKTWNKVIERWSPYGKARVIENITNFTNFYEKIGNYVTLSLDLENLQYPQKYKVLFYADSRKIENGPLIIDFARWVAIPPLELSILTKPNYIEVRGGERKNIEVIVNSSHGYEPTINLYTINQSKDFDFDFEPDKLRITSLGTASTLLSINVPNSAQVGERTLFIYANSSYPPEQLIKPKGNVLTGLSYYTSSIPIENIVLANSLSVRVLPPLSIAERYGDIISSIALISFLIIPTILSLKSSLFTKRLPDLISINNVDILHVNAAIIAGVLIFLSLEGSNENVETRITLITANIVFPFAISTIAALTNHPTFSIRLMVSGFINLMISILLIAFIKT